jgi:hypothetical protein
MFKFRVWDKERKKMDYEDNYTLFPDGRLGRTDTDNNGEYTLDPVCDQDRYIIMLASPFLDHNGKRIHDGDIIRITNKNEVTNFTIKYEDGIFYAITEYIFALKTVIDCHFHVTEIIGNIHEQE